jgi:hypothetical protein
MARSRYPNALPYCPCRARESAKQTQDLHEALPIALAPLQGPLLIAIFRKILPAIEGHCLLQPADGFVVVLLAVGAPPKLLQMGELFSVYPTVALGAQGIASAPREKKRGPEDLPQLGHAPPQIRRGTAQILAAWPQILDQLISQEESPALAR